MIFFIFFIISFILLLLDLSFFPFVYRPLFSLALGLIGCLILKKQLFIANILLISVFLYIFTSLEQALKLIIVLAISLSLYSLIHFKNIPLIIFIGSLIGSIIIFAYDLKAIFFNFIFTFILSLLFYKIGHILKIYSQNY